MRTPKQQRELDNAIATLRNPGGGATLESFGFVERKPAEPTPRPLTPAESRALDALVEWRRARVAWLAAHGRKLKRSAQLFKTTLLAEAEMHASADAVVAERDALRSRGETGEREVEHHG